jgi:hypothetical protein
MGEACGGISGIAQRREAADIKAMEISVGGAEAQRIGTPESVMSRTTPETSSKTRTAIAGRIGRFGRSTALASAAVAALALGAVPTPALAHGNNNGAAIGLGILGGVIAGAAIAAATAPPAYAAPPTYYYPPQGYYYNPPPNYYYPSQPYYSYSDYGYPYYNYYR